jgi:hypothetical protein
MQMSEVIDFDFETAREIRDGAVFAECDQGEIWQLFSVSYTLEGRTHSFGIWAKDKMHVHDVMKSIRETLVYDGPIYEE